jgi:hypothetical protein
VIFGNTRREAEIFVESANGQSSVKKFCRAMTVSAKGVYMKKHIMHLGALAVALMLTTMGCADTADSGPSAAETAANTFKTAHATALTLTVETVVISDKSAVNAALAAYNALSAGAQALLTTEKAKLDALSVKIGQLETAAAAQAAANTFTTGHAAALALTADTVAITDKGIVEAALTAYNGLSDAAKAQLPADTGTKLQALLDKIAQLEASADAAAFTGAHAAALALTADTVAITNKDAVNNALTAYNALSPPAKALLAEEKELLDGLEDKIAQLEAAANQAAAEDFKTTHAAALALTVSNAAIAHKDAVDAALEAYNRLSAAVKALLAGEKALLDNLAARIAQLYPEHELTFLEKTLIVEDRTGGLMNQADLDKIQEAFTLKEAELLQLEAEGNAVFIYECRVVLDRGFRIIVDNSGYRSPTVIDWSTLSASIEYFQRYPNVGGGLYAAIINVLYLMPAPGTGE